MTRLFAAAAVVLGLLLLVAFARYETIAPCGMLRSELKRQAFKDAGVTGNETGLALVGVTLGALAIDQVIEAKTRALGPIECTRALVRLHSDGLESLLNDTKPVG